MQEFHSNGKKSWHVNLILRNKYAINKILFKKYSNKLPRRLLMYRNEFSECIINQFDETINEPSNNTSKQVVRKG